MGCGAVINALEAGYNVRAAVRSQSKADAILAAASTKALAPGKKLQSVLVPDIIADGAYDEAVGDAKCILHIVSPIAFESDDYERDLVAPAVKETTEIPTSALKAPTIERIVITSSIIAVTPWNDSIRGESKTVFTADDRIPDQHAPFEHYFHAYAASKANALNATDAYLQDNSP